MQKLFFLFLVLFFARPIFADDISGRQRIDSHWQFLRQDVGSPWEVFRPVKAGKPESVPLWTDVTLPHCFNATDGVDPTTNYYQGPGWYRKNIEVDNPYGPDGHTFIEFEGAGQTTQVYVFTTLVATHVGGYDRWKADITEAARAFLQSPEAARFGGKVPIAVRCDNSRDAERIPSSMSDFNIYGGLYRHVNLLYQPATAIDRIDLTPQMDRRAMQVAIHMARPSARAVVQLRLKDPAGRQIYFNPRMAAGADSVARCTIEVRRPQRWDVDHPQLYTLEAELEIDGHRQRYTTKAGFRSFVFKPNGPFFLNGRRLLLNGTHRHEDHAGVGAAMTDSMIRQEMVAIKEMGANFIRLGHYQQSDLVLQLCDSLGLLVWEEIPWCRGGLGGEAYRQQAEQMLAHMIAQHRNHPSVILWGLGNENDWPGDFPTFSKQDIADFMSHLNTLAHGLDSTRLTTIRRCDFCSDIPDVYSPSIWAGWYSGRMTDYRRMTEAAIDRYPRFVHAEWGGDSHVGRHSERTDLETVEAGDRNGDWSEDYVVRLFDWTLHEQQSMPRLTGSAFWTFKDFSTPLRPNNPIPYVNQKGVVERDGTPKESYYVFQSYWARKPMVHIFGHSIATRWGREGEPKQVLVYSNCKEVELFVNGMSQGKRRRNVANYPAAGFHWNVTLRSGQNEIKAVADGGLVDVINQEYQSEAWGAPHHIRISTHAIEDGMVLVEAQIEDERNLKCLDASQVITFGVTGDATLIENQGTSTGSRIIQASNGRARIKVKVSEGGVAAVSVQAKGLPTAVAPIMGVRFPIAENRTHINRSPMPWVI